MDLQFQWKFVSIFICIALTGAVTSTMLFIFFSIRKIEELRWRAHIDETSINDVLEHLYVYTVFFNFIFILVLLIFTGIWMLNKIKGPVYRMIKGLNEIRDGDLSNPIILRYGDDFKDVAVSLNGMLEKTKESVGSLYEEYDAISQALIDLEIEHAGKAPLEQKTDALIISVKSLREKIPHS